MVYGYLSHSNPLGYDPSAYTDSLNGFALWLTQVCIIIGLCMILGRAFQWAGQPMVLGELLAGVLLGPSAFGNIPGFTAAIIPDESKPLLKVTAGIGLSLFLFCVGLETDTAIMSRYWKKVAIITLPGMALPFTVSIGIARLVWQLETDRTASFTSFFLFLATTMAVTSLSVLSRIMAELKILQTTLGAITIAAGVCNDLIGYILLALASALSGGGKQITALYELLAAVALVFFLWFVFRPLMFRELRRTGFDMGPDSTDAVPEHLLVIVIVGALASAFYTDSIGVHPIVGAFAFGVCCPHGHFAVRITESIETPVMMVFLPLYFVTTGLTTDVKLLNTGTTWGLIILISCGVFISKFTATTVAAKAAGLTTNEAMCIASLMQSKAVIELVILSAGRDAGVIPLRVFSMMMVVFLTTTLTVRPLSRLIYFSRSMAHVDGTTEKEEHVEGPPPDTSTSDFPITIALTSVNPEVSALMAFLKLVGGGGDYYDERSDDNKLLGRVVVDLLRLLPLEYTTSTVLRLINLSNDNRRRDELLESLKTFAYLNEVPTSVSLAAIRNLSADTKHGGNAVGIASQHHQVGNAALRPPADTFPVPEAEMTAFAARINARAQARLRISPHTAPTDELGTGMTVVTWEGTSSAASLRSSFWLLGAAASASVVPSASDEDAYYRASADARALPARLFDEVRSATGVLLERDILRVRHGYRGTALQLCNPSSSYTARLAAEAALGLQPSTRARVFVPFFGGNDDRAAVELCKRLASAGHIEGVVVALSSVSGVGLENALHGEGVRRRAGASASGVEGENEPAEGQETINLQTIHRAEATTRDARFLFQHAAAAPPTAACIASAELSVVRHANVVFLTLPAPPDAERVRPVLDALVPLLNPSKDFLLLGRGKLGQRPREFRVEVERLHAAVRSGHGNGVDGGEVQAEQQRTAALEEVRKIGRTLGAAVEAALLCGARSDVLVIQARKE